MSMAHRIAIGLLVVVATVCLGQALNIPAKAWLAQRLLERAWSRPATAGERPRPWPWADTRPVARLQQPRLGIDQVVLAGASGRVLAFGPGWVPGTVRPGRRGNVVVSGHRDTHFRWLAHLRANDALRVESTDGSRREYIVSTLAVHHATDRGLLDPYAGDQLQLVTCYPFDAVRPGTAWRFVVTALPTRQGST